ncbi:Wzz/FepE/Etk N-terminal domain-containing protein [Niveibacterium umoris]|uniref:Polysaccharide chain length determinant protein (PEP-CTERM system associated) n=1 Tax=Niveibacterium umoris TaxID=1193620 RepID=A0A840BLD0_9RHOO|nr:XrtA system polysaccharide chain length determinant [Niveibacterium umoris]MBB4012339.1 polysaccharide chain length determinant protein (PEP-CTERM system associated) [Niveibacterium umoris]
MWRYRWWGLLAAWIGGVILAVVVMMIPDKYEARARVFVDTQSVLKPLMQGLAVPTNVEQQVTILSRTLISRPNVEKLIRMADLDLDVKTREKREILIDDLIGRLQIVGAGRDDLFVLTFKDTNPERAKRVVQALVSIFVESGLGDKRKDSDEARRFIEEQIKSYETKLADAENRLKEFKLKNLALFGDSGKDAVTQIGELNSKLNQARLELREVENSRDAVRRQLAGEDPVFLPDSGQAPSGVSIPDIDGRIDAMKKQLDALLQRYTDQHPDVVGTRRVIEQLEAQKKQEVESRRKSGGMSGSLGANPVYQQLKLSLSESEANVASLKTRVAEYESRLNAMRGSQRMLPEVEAEFAQLNRDYEINKKNYESLVSRREAANMSVEMDASSGVAEFRLIDPPSVPSKPAAPNRALLMPVSGVVSLLIGMLVSFLVFQVRPTFFDGRGLRELSGLPVLGVVTLIEDPVRSRRERVRSIYFAGGLLGLVGVFTLMTAILVLRAFGT